MNTQTRAGTIARLMIAQRSASGRKIVALKAAYYSLAYGIAASKAKALYLVTLRGTKA